MSVSTFFTDPSCEDMQFASGMLLCFGFVAFATTIVSQNSPAGLTGKLSAVNAVLAMVCMVTGGLMSISISADNFNGTQSVFCPPARAIS